jgi:hypothetical protein
LWVPEIGGVIDPANEAHDMIMSMFGGLPKGERNRIRTRVRSSMGQECGQDHPHQPPLHRRNKARHHTKHTYALRGAMYCGLCDRKMRAHPYKGYVYLRCRYPEEYALANGVEHPRNVFVRENQVTALEPSSPRSGPSFVPRRGSRAGS